MKLVYLSVLYEIAPEDVERASTALAVHHIECSETPEVHHDPAAGTVMLRGQQTTAVEDGETASCASLCDVSAKALRDAGIAATIRGNGVSWTGTL